MRRRTYPTSGNACAGFDAAPTAHPYADTGTCCTHTAPGRQDSLAYLLSPPSPNTSYDAAATPEQEACPQHGYCGQLEPGERLTAAAWLDDDRMYLADHAGNIRLLNITTGGIKTVLTGLTAPQGLTALDGRLYVSDTGNLCDLIAQLPGTDAEIRRCRVIRPEESCAPCWSASAPISYHTGLPRMAALTSRKWL